MSGDRNIESFIGLSARGRQVGKARIGQDVGKSGLRPPDSDPGWAKRVAREMVRNMASPDTRRAKGKSDAKRRAQALAVAYDRRVQDCVLDYQRAVKLAAAAGDKVFLQELRAAADAYPRLAECVEDWAELPGLEDPRLVDLAETAAPTVTEDMVKLRDLLAQVLEQVREDPRVIYDLVKAADSDPSLQLVLQVIAGDDPELRQLIKEAEEMLLDG